MRQHATGRGAGSGIDLDFVFCVVWTVNEDGVVTRVESYLPHQDAEALEAAGLRE